MPSKQFEAIWLAISKEDRWRVRFRDRSRAELAVVMSKEAANRSSFFKLLPMVPGRLDSDGNDELQLHLREAQKKIWRFELDAGNEQLRVLPGAADPLALVLMLELEVVRTLASHDALDLKKARAVAASIVDSLDQLASLSSLSIACRLQAQVALAEALLMRALMEALNLSGSTPLISTTSIVTVVATCLHRSASIYNELTRYSTGDSNHKHNSRCAKLPEAVALNLDSRVHFGVAVLRVCGGLLWRSNPLEWLQASLVPVFENEGDDSSAMRASLNALLAHTRSSDEREEAEFKPRRRWAELLLLLVGPMAFRVLAAEVGDASDRTRRFLVIAQYRQALQELRTKVCHEHLQSPLLLWAAGAIDQAAASLPASERAHLIRFDAGRLHLARLLFDESERQLALVSRCESAPYRLRAFSSVFLATTYLMPTTSDVASARQGGQASSLLRSARVLLRSAHRCLLHLDSADQVDQEVATLRHRIEFYIECGDAHLLLLPAEVHCVLGNGLLQINCGANEGMTSTKSSLKNTENHDHYSAVLRFLDSIGNTPEDLRDNCMPSAMFWRSNWHLLRTIALFHILHMDDNYVLSEKYNLVRAELEKLIKHIEKMRASDETLRLLQSFVVPVALFYHLKLSLLERQDYPNFAPGLKIPHQNLLLDLWCQGEGQGNPFWGLYEGKVRALRRLLSTRRLSSSLSTCSSDGDSGRSRSPICAAHKNEED